MSLKAWRFKRSLKRDSSRLNSLEKTARELGAQGVDILVATVRNSDDIGARSRALFVLEALGDRRASEPLIQLLSPGSIGYDEHFCHWVVRTLGAIGDANAVEPLLRSARRNHFNYTAEMDSLTELDDPTAVDYLIKALKGKEWEYAGEALGKIGDLRAVEPLIKLLADSELGNYRHLVAEWLGDLGDPRAVEPLANALSAWYPPTRRDAAESLGKIGDPRAFEPLLETLADSESEVRREAASSLGDLGDPRAVEPLVETLGDSESEVRRQAASSLGDLGDRRAVEPLIKTLADRSSKVSQQAASSLGDLGDPRAVEPLIKTLADSESEARRQAASSLGKIGDPRAVKPLTTSLWSVGHEAEMSLANLLDEQAARCLRIKADHRESLKRLASSGLVVTIGCVLLSILVGIGAAIFWKFPGLPAFISRHRIVLLISGAALALYFYLYNMNTTERYGDGSCSYWRGCPRCRLPLVYHEYQTGFGSCSVCGYHEDP